MIFKRSSQVSVSASVVVSLPTVTASDSDSSSSSSSIHSTSSSLPTTTEIPSTKKTEVIKNDVSSMVDENINSSSTTAKIEHLPQDEDERKEKECDEKVEGGIECPLCVLNLPEESIPPLDGCQHRVCSDCMQRYIKNEINHSRLNISCPICPEPIHPNAIRRILKSEEFYQKYETFMIRRVLAAEPDARRCPAPDCGYVVLATGCASCPRLKCGRNGCDTYFCYHCKQEWHPNETCDAARAKRNRKYNLPLTTTTGATASGSKSSKSKKSKKGEKDSTPKKSKNKDKTSTSQSSFSSLSSSSCRDGNDDIKECPICGSRIIKMNDGSCNHMTCSICETEFCWLCLKEISTLHYISPSGCTMWGKKPWSRKKKILWQLGLLAGAPVCILLIAGFAVPAIMIGVPIWVGKLLYNKLEKDPMSRRRKNAIITGGVLLSMCVSPILSALALGIGVPLILGYVYGVVPISLCRSGGCGLSPTQSLDNIRHELDLVRSEASSIDEKSVTNASIELLNNDGSSTRALAGSIMSRDQATSDMQVVPVEIHHKDSKGTPSTSTLSASKQTLAPAQSQLAKESQEQCA